MARLKLQYWDSVVSDCEACLAVSPDSMKANYYLAQAQLEMRDFDAALRSALAAHKLCAATNDRSLAAVTNLVLRCKKERWDDRERKRLREARDLEREVLDLLARDRDDALATANDDDIERREIAEESDAKMQRLKDIFERARAHDDRRREVPEWAIDDISFGFMVDPVIVSFDFVACIHACIIVSFSFHAFACQADSFFSLLRQKQASLTSVLQSWNICADIPVTP